MATKIVTKNSSTASAAPTASDLVQGELAVNVTDKRLYTENASGAIVELGTNPLGAVTMASTLAVAGDANFDSGTLFVDVSANAVGVGTSSPRTLINASSATGAILTLESSDTSLGEGDVVGQINFYANDASTNSTGNKAFIKAYSETAGGNKVGLDFATSSSTSATGVTAMTIDSSGNVGIGTSAVGGSSTNRQITSVGSASSQLTLTGSGSYSTNVGTNGTVGYLEVTGANNLALYTNSTERMRIDSSGTVLVGNTDSTPYDRTSGNAIALGDGLISSAQSGGNAAIFNRMTNDGSIVQFRKDGTTVGSIGTYEGTTVVAGKYTGLKFNYSNATNSLIHTVSPSGVVRDAVDDLGYAGSRFKDLYLSGGVVFGTTGGSVSSKTLDDYEEGTWTPVLGSSVGSSGAVGTYTKIGNRCFFTAEITMGASSNTGHAYISLPFSASSSTSNTGGASIAWTDYGAATYAYILPSYARFYVRSVTGAELTYANVSLKTFRFSGSIIVA